jgi:uncharacterized membrane protein
MDVLAKIVLNISDLCLKFSIAFLNIWFNVGKPGSKVFDCSLYFSTLKVFDNFDNIVEGFFIHRDTPLRSQVIDMVEFLSKPFDKFREGIIREVSKGCSSYSVCSNQTACKSLLHFYTTLSFILINFLT